MGTLAVDPILFAPKLSKMQRQIVEEADIRMTDTTHELCVHPMLFPFQQALVQWALKKKRTALFADTGLGKTLMQLEWARMTGKRTLILAPLAVALQTVREGQKIQSPCSYARDGRGTQDLITVTNYEMVDKFDPQDYGAVVLDESSILKDVNAKTRSHLTALFSDTEYRMCCTATPSPNDIAELTNHAEFLGVMRRPDVLAKFFVHDDDGWRLKGHAHSAFWAWMSTWAMALRLPSDLGFASDGYMLPCLSEQLVEVIGPAQEYAQRTGQLFATEMGGITGRQTARRMTTVLRSQRIADVIAADPDNQWIVWCGLNDEGRNLAALLQTAVLVEGKDSLDYKIDTAMRFTDGSIRVLISKPSIMGFGMNFQNCHKMAFLGLSDSFETYYQAIRRCWRYGQKYPVEVLTVLSDLERPIWDNVQRKAAEHSLMMESMMGYVREHGKTQLRNTTTTVVVPERRHDSGQDWAMTLGDSTKELSEMDTDSVDFSIYSPPFLSLFTYSDDPRDLGNSQTDDDFYDRFHPIAEQLFRVIKPGRIMVVHVAQVATKLVQDGWIGLKDFRGNMIRVIETAGFSYHGDITIDKNPQAQAVRTHAKALLFKQLRKDASWLRPGLADYLLVFRKPGEPTEPIHPDITNEQWIEWAHPVWLGIRENDTLNGALARAERDERHIAPLQLPVIERCIQLWSNPGDLVLSPFAGIGSEGYVALRQKRRFVGVELKESYFNVACKNLEDASTITQGTLLETCEVEVSGWRAADVGTLPERAGQAPTHTLQTKVIDAAQ